MKKTLKRISALFLVIVLIMSLCGCTMKDMKQTQAFWGENGEVLWQGEKYLKFTETYNGFEPLTDYVEMTFVTKSDVPLLLQHFFGDSMYISTDKNFLIGDEYIYCKDSEFDKMKKKLEKGGDLTSFCYQYYNDEYETEYFRFYQNQVDLINKIFDDVKPIIMDYDDFDNKYYDYPYYTEVYKCSDDMMFREYSFDYYNQDDDYMFAIMDEEDYRVYEIPSEYVGDIKAIFEKVEENLF